jgi:hypothetical protein
MIAFDPLKPEEAGHPWVTLTRCFNLVEADLLATRLRGAGISVFIPDEFLMQSISWAVNTYGFVRVQVPPSQHQAAREILDES